MGLNVMKRKKKVLFVLKRRQMYGDVSQTRLVSSGLSNSARFVSDVLDARVDCVSKVVEVIDNNGIDREIHHFKPDVVIIEALWVVPEKFEVLHRLHPRVQFIVRLHSNVPFLANEGIAFEWLDAMAKLHYLKVGVNHVSAFEDLAKLYPELYRCNRLLLLPNYYPIKGSVSFFSERVRRFNRTFKQPIIDGDIMDVGCFGAIRPMKNHVMQALAAISVANRLGRRLRFHVNGTRVEQRGDVVLKNLRAVFEGSGHRLIEHQWMDHEAFVNLIRRMDVTMQVSFSETFNIVTADSVAVGVPVVVSDEIGWVSRSFRASPVNSNDIEVKLLNALGCSNGPWRNLRGLKRYNSWSMNEWDVLFR